MVRARRKHRGGLRTRNAVGEVIASVPAVPPTAASPPGKGSPIGAKSWSIVAGDINVHCPAGFTCKSVAEDNGFVEVQLVDTNSGRKYYQTIVAERNATGNAESLAFSSVATVRENPNAGADENGASVHTVVRQAPAWGEKVGLVSTARIETGWARGAAADMELTQASEITDFNYVANLDADGGKSGYRLDLGPGAGVVPQMQTYFSGHRWGHARVAGPPGGFMEGGRSASGHFLLHRSAEFRHADRPHRAGTELSARAEAALHRYRQSFRRRASNGPDFPGCIDAIILAFRRIRRFEQSILGKARMRRSRSIAAM